MKFTCVKALTTHIINREGAKEITLNGYDISEFYISDLKTPLSKIPNTVHTLIIPNKNFFDFACQSIFLRMVDIFAALPTHVKTVKIDISLIGELSFGAQKVIKGIRADLNIIGVDFEKYIKYYPSVLLPTTKAIITPKPIVAAPLNPPITGANTHLLFQPAASNPAPIQTKVPTAACS